LFPNLIIQVLGRHGRSHVTHYSNTNDTISEYRHHSAVVANSAGGLGIAPYRHIYYRGTADQGLQKRQLRDH
jgi:hypothetical protein